MKPENYLCLRCGSHSELRLNIFPHIVERCESLGLRYGVHDQLQTETSRVIINTPYYTGSFGYSGTAVTATDGACALFSAAQLRRVKTLRTMRLLRVSE